jgi:NitT/TauT family transport system substrate-binding protein
MAQTKVQLNMGGKIAILVIIGVALFFGYKKFGDKLFPAGESASDVSGMMSDGSKSTGTGGKNSCIEVGVVTWGGYAGGEYFNNGFQDNAKSRFRTDYGICANFRVMDDFASSRNAFRSGDIDLLWVTMDAFPTEAGNFGEPVKFLFQADWSRGGDAIVVKGAINSVGDLLGKKIAVAEATPSHTFLLWMLDMAGLSVQDVEIVVVPSAIDAATAFKSGKVDAAVVWSPDDETCVADVAGSKILINTKQATHIIADGFMVKESVFNAKKDQLRKFVEGWLKGSDEINNDPDAKQKAIEILATGLKIDKPIAEKAIDNVRLTTYGDNKDFFGMNRSYTNVKGEDLYNKMGKVYSALRLAEKANIPEYAKVIDTDFIGSINLTSGSVAVAETQKSFTKATVQEATGRAIASKPVRVTFPSGSAVLDENAKELIGFKFVDDARAFPNARIRIEGNTDAVGDHASNVALSKARANSVVSYLVNTHGMDANRFVVVGNGPDKPICNDSSVGCYAKNRRTDFQILAQ